MLDEAISPASRARLLSALRGFCKWLIRNQYISMDPTIDFETPQTARHLPVALTDKQLAAVMVAAADPDERLRAHWPARDVALVGVLAGCGLRSSELTTLTNSALHRVEPHRVTVEGKGSKQRTVPLSPEVLKAIDTYLSERTDIDPTRLKPKDIIFVRRNGEPLNNQALQLLVSNWLGAAGVPPPQGRRSTSSDTPTQSDKSTEEPPSLNSEPFSGTRTSRRQASTSASPLTASITLHAQPPSTSYSLVTARDNRVLLASKEREMVRLCGRSAPPDTSSICVDPTALRSVSIFRLRCLKTWESSTTVGPSGSS